MTALRPITDLTGSSITEAQAKLWFSDLRDYLNGLLGADGTVATAKSTLGITAQNATNTAFTAAGNIIATNVQAAIEELDAEKASTASLSSYAPLNSPTFTGTPSGPTPAAGDNTTKFATTAWVLTNAGSFPAGTRMIFQQTAAPTGWTKDTTAAINDSLLRLVTGTVSSGGSVGFSTFNASATGATTLSTAQIPSHTHMQNYYAYKQYGGTTAAPQAGTGNRATTASDYMATDATGGGGSHTHSLSVPIKYYDFIIASKN